MRDYVIETNWSAVQAECPHHRPRALHSSLEFVHWKNGDGKIRCTALDDPINGGAHYTEAFERALAGAETIRKCEPRAAHRKTDDAPDATAPEPSVPPELPADESSAGDELIALGVREPSLRAKILAWHEARQPRQQRVVEMEIGCDVLRRYVAWIVARPNWQLAFAGSAFAVGLAALEGISQTQMARTIFKKNGQPVTRAAVSKETVFFKETFFGASRYGKSDAARRRYAADKSAAASLNPNQEPAK
jgi:hypothetical protein